MGVGHGGRDREGGTGAYTRIFGKIHAHQCNLKEEEQQYNQSEYVGESLSALARHDVHPTNK